MRYWNITLSFSKIMSKNISNKKVKAKKRIFIESIAVFFIIASPFIFKSHDYFPADPDETINIFGYVIDNNGFHNLNTYMWYLLSKLVPLYLLVIWFFTCKHWWYHVLLIPICLYAFQLFEVLYSEDNFIDTENTLWLLPVCMIIVPIVYFIRIKLYDKHVHGIDLEAMDAELKALKEKQRLQEEKKKIKTERNLRHQESIQH